MTNFRPSCCRRISAYLHNQSRSATLSCSIAVLAAITLSWNPNQESDLAGYRVYVGERSGRYDEVHGAGLQTFFSLDNLRPGRTYFVAVTAFDLSGNESGFSNEVSFRTPGEIEPPPPPPPPPTSNTKVEKSLATNYNYPNPFNPDNETTTLRYYLGEAGEISIRIFDVKGDVVKEVLSRRRKSAGEHTEDSWDGTNNNGEKVSPGLYYCEISNSEQTSTFRIAVVRR